jgi:hypothetical protein
MYNEKPHIVCELGIRGDKGGLLYLHMFYNADQSATLRRQGKLTTGSREPAPHHAHSALFVVMCATRVHDRAEFSHLRESVSASSWTWVIAEALLKEGMWPHAELQESGSVVCVAHDVSFAEIELGRTFRLSSISKSHEADPDGQIDLPPGHAFIQSIAPGLGINIFPGQLGLECARLVPLDVREEKDAPVASFVHNCVAQVLYHGMYRDIIAGMQLGEFENER